MRKILCIGYSVTERYGFVEEVNRLSEANGSEIKICKSGWGGHRIDSIAYMIDIILDNFEFDEVVLELFTSGLRIYGMPRIKFFLDEILAATARRSIPVYLLSLYDSEIDYSEDFLTKEVSRIAGELSIPFLDVASYVYNLPASKIASLLIDTVHPSAEGEALYGVMLYDFLLSNAPILSYLSEYRSSARTLGAISVSKIATSQATSSYDKHAFPIPFVDLPEKNYLNFELGDIVEVEAIMLCYGPNTGYLSIKSNDSNDERVVLAYDSFSYYERTGVFPIERLSGRVFSIYQSAELPAVELRKGVATAGPRKGKIAFLFFSKFEVNQIHSELPPKIEGVLLKLKLKLLVSFLDRLCGRFRGRVRA